MKIQLLISCILLFISACSSSDRDQNTNETDVSIAMIDTTAMQSSIIISQKERPISVSETAGNVSKVVVPQFTILKREREDYNDQTPRIRFHIKTPKIYTEYELNIIADSLLNKERNETGISEIWVNYYLPNKKIHHSNSYGLSIRLRTEHSSTIFQREKKKLGYNPPKIRDLSKANKREKQLWGAFDLGQTAGYEAGYKDGQKGRRVCFSFDSDYPTDDEWIEQSYKQGYEVGYLNGFDDAGGSR